MKDCRLDGQTKIFIRGQLTDDSENYTENYTWMFGNMKFISSVDQDISRVSKANE